MASAVMQKFRDDGQTFPTSLTLAWLSAWQGWLRTLPPVLSSQLRQVGHFIEDLQLALLEAHGAALLKMDHAYVTYEENVPDYEKFMAALTEELEEAVGDFTKYFFEADSDLGLENDRFMEPVIVFGEILEKKYPLRVIKQLVRFPELIRHRIVEGQTKAVSELRRWYLSQTETAQSCKKRRGANKGQTPDSLPPVAETPCAATEADTESQPVEIEELD